jgi:hypothetical protein
MHPFFVQTTRQVARTSEGHVLADGYWVDAADLLAGDLLLNDDGSWAEVVSSDVTAEPLRAYNLTVEGWHTYFVAANVDAAPVWVHNWCGSPKIKQSPLLVREAQRSGRNIKVQEDNLTSFGYVAQFLGKVQKPNFVFDDLFVSIQHCGFLVLWLV